jgi:polyisoprenoid-binding protein YceI
MRSKARVVGGIALAIYMSIAVGQVSFGQAKSASRAATKNDDTKQKMTPVKISGGVARLSPENTKIEFVGTHVGEDKKPRLGGFKKFSGQIEIDANNQMVTSINFEIDVTSIWTEFKGLTKHLLTDDFFDVKKFGNSKFVSTKIESDKAGRSQVTGNLTLMGNTKEISFPISSKVSDSGLVLQAKFQIDRTFFGMDKLTKGVDKEVSVAVVVGQKNSPKKEFDPSKSGQR